MNKRISPKIKRFWGISEAGFSFMSTMETTFLILFLTDVACLPLAYVAIITAFSGIADMISAVLAGAVIDKFNLKGGKYRPWLLYCSPVVVIFFVLMFTKIGSDLTTLIICSLGYIISHFAWNIAWTANRALIGSLTDDATERAFLSGRIAAGMATGKIIASYFVPVLSTALLAAFILVGPTVGYTATAAIASITFAICYFVHYQITKGYDVPAEVDSSKPRPKPVTLPQMLKTIVSNPQLVILLVGDTVRLVGYYMVAAMAAYYAKIVLGDAAALSVMLVMYNVGTLVGSLLSKPVAGKVGTRKATLISTALTAIMFVLIYFVAKEAMVMYVMFLIAEVIFGISYGLTSSLYSACGTISEYKTGNDVKGTIMACSSLAIKISLVIRGVIISGALALISYTPEMEITASAQTNVAAVCMLIPAAFTALAFIVLFFFKNSDSELTRMENEISARKQNA